MEVNTTMTIVITIKIKKGIEERQTSSVKEGYTQERKSLQPRQSKSDHHHETLIRCSL